jgi:hypothetical protein
MPYRFQFIPRHFAPTVGTIRDVPIGGQIPSSAHLAPEHPVRAIASPPTDAKRIPRRRRHQLPFFVRRSVVIAS